MKSFEAFFKNNSSVMLLIDAANGKIADANQAALRFYGYRRSDIKNLNIADINILSPKEVKKQIDAIQDKKITTALYKHKTAGNIIKDVEAHLSPVTLSDKKYNFAIIHDVTELKQKEEESNLFRNIAENSIPFIGIANMNREVVYFNKSMHKAFAVPQNADLSKYRVFDFYTLRGIKTIRNAFKTILETGYWRGENEMKSLDGRIYQVIQTIILIRDGNGIPQYTSSTAIDITTKKTNERELINLASRYKTMMSAANEGIHIVDKNMNVVETNEAFCNMLGYSSKELLKMNIADFDARWENNTLKKIYNKIMSGHLVFETHHRRKDGKIINVEISATRMTLEGKDYLYASSRDISRRKKLESALKESEENLKRGERIGKFGYMKADLKTGEYEFSPGVLEIYGLRGKKVTSEQLKKMRLQEYDLPLDNAVKKMIEENIPIDTEYKIKKAGDGRITDIHAIFRYDNQNKVIFGTIQDITGRKQAEEQLKLSEEKYRHLISDITIGIVVHGPGGEVKYHNKKALEMLGLNSEQLIGKTPFSPSWNVIHENGDEYPRETLPAIVALRTKKIVKNKVMGVYQPLMNDRVWLMVTAIPETSPDGSLTQVIVTFHDISETYKKETEILRLNYELKELNRYLQRVRVDERNNLAIETHNKLGQKLVGLKFETDFIRNNLPLNQLLLQEKARTVTAELEAMLRDFSSIYNEVNPTLIEDLDLSGALENLFYSSPEKWNMIINFQWKIKTLILSNDIKWIIYKTIEGYLYHAFLYTKPGTANVALTEQKKSIRISIHYKSLHASGKNTGSPLMINLIELRERVISYGGHVEINYPAGRSVKINVSIPV